MRLTGDTTKRQVLPIHPLIPSGPDPSCPRRPGTDYRSNATLAIFRAEVTYPRSAQFTPSERLPASLHSSSRCAGDCGLSVSPSLPTSSKCSGNTPNNHTRPIPCGPLQIARTANRATTRVVDELVGLITPGFDGDCEILLLASVETAQAVARVTLVASDEWARTRLAIKIVGCRLRRGWGSSG